MNGNKDVLNYLDNLPIEEKEALQNLRNQILNISPLFEERLSRGVPFFYYKGKRAIGFRSTKKKLSFFIMQGNVLKTMKQDFIDYQSSSTVIWFTPEKPLTKNLLEKLVLARINEIDNSFFK